MKPKITYDDDSIGNKESKKKDEYVKTSIPTISTGEPSTLKTYRKMSAILTGEDSAATKMLDEKIKDQGENEIVITDEGQMLFLIINMGLRNE